MIKYLSAFMLVLCVVACSESQDRPPTDYIEKLLEKLVIEKLPKGSVVLTDVNHVISEQRGDEKKPVVKSRFEFTVEVNGDQVIEVDSINGIDDTHPQILIIKKLFNDGDEVTGEIVTSSTLDLGRWKVDLDEISGDIRNARDRMVELSEFMKEGREYLFQDDEEVEKTKKRYVERREELKRLEEEKRAREKAEKERQRQLAIQREKERIQKIRTDISGDWVSVPWHQFYKGSSYEGGAVRPTTAPLVRFRIPKGTSMNDKIEFQLIDSLRPWVSSPWLQSSFEFDKRRENFKFNTINLNTAGRRQFGIERIQGRVFSKEKLIGLERRAKNSSQYMPFSKLSKKIDALKQKKERYDNLVDAFLTKHNAIKFHSSIKTSTFRDNTYALVYVENHFDSEWVREDTSVEPYWGRKNDQKRRSRWQRLLKDSITFTNRKAKGLPCGGNFDFGALILHSGILGFGEAGAVKIAVYNVKEQHRNARYCTVELVEKFPSKDIWWHEANLLFKPE
ncbi:hypothetical protein [Kordiimonas laminariae]|uniref:hypothetical protein n=1 Tax=Kordiimonas laminariae TaxID=2917717 RepID=UPI001FF51EF2|nr:hypothetical protein [Kordiimonas laminariae]MCK0067815.1 hypothetical protein [Kordiimonas laminariae]